MPPADEQSVAIIIVRTRLNIKQHVEKERVKQKERSSR
jgi:hypothetical protein